MTPNTSLYDRVGGETTVERLVDEFYECILNDPELGPFFAESKMKHQQSMFREFISAALDGPAKYTGRSVTEAHQGRGIKPKHLQRFVEHLFKVLRDFGLENRDIDEIIARINTYADEVTGSGVTDG